MKKITTIVLLIGLSIGAAYAATAAKGVFSVAEDKTVQFANANEAGLVQWSTAYEWREAQKNAEGHNGWYVLSSDEWTYLLVTRDADLNNLGTVAGDSGLIILPDGWVQPSGVPVYKPADEGFYYKNNIYTADQWKVMAASGAVFLPCRGYGYNDEEDEDKYKEENQRDHGTYWSSTANGEDKAYAIRFYNYTIHDQNFDPYKNTYRSVILVKTVTVGELDEEHDATAFAVDMTASRGSDCVFVHRTLVKDSTLYTLCLPFDVPNIDESPLVGAEVFEFKGGRVTGTTGNEVLNLNMSRLQGKRLIQGVPYILRWAKTNPVQTLSYLYFYDVENWDDDTNTATDPGNETIKFHGVYPRDSIDGYRTTSEAHYNFFIGANNTLYWPDASYVGHKMKGFRGYFYITPGGGPSPVSRYRNMPAVWSIEEETPTDLTNEGVKELKNERTKLFLDGQIVLIIDGVKYDMQGRKITDN